MVVRNTELLAAARPMNAGAESTGTAAKSPPAHGANAASKASAGKASKRAAQDADARHMREFAEVPYASRFSHCLTAYS